MMKHWYPLALTGLLLLAPSCSDKEEPEPNPEVSQATDGVEASGTQDPLAANATAEEGVGEAPSTTEGTGEETAGTKTPGGSLRDRMEVSEAPPVDDQPWSTAITLEERMASLEKTLASGEEPFVVDMHDFGGWDFDEGKEQPFPDHILALDGKKFTIRGFMMPDIDFENIRKFHLVRSLFSCCFGAPPQLNEILRVTLADENGMEYTYNTVEVTGTLSVVFEMEDGLVEDLFRLDNTTYRIIDFDDPEAPSDFDATTGFGDFIPQGPTEY
jgi:hypothetical protein